MLDDFLLGDAISDHNGVKAYPAMRQQSDEKYIVKVISEPSSQTKLEALLLTGAYADEGSALAYFKGLAEDIVSEAETLKHMAELEGFCGFEDCQLEESEDQKGYDVFLLAPYRRSLARQFSIAPLTQLSAANLGLDLCAALTVARRAGYLYADLKPENIYITPEGEYKIGDLGFIRLDGLKYATLPERYRSAYTAPEAKDAYAALNETMDVYALGLILYQVYNNNLLPDVPEGEAMAAPQYADYEMSEIILKACAADPAERWQSPVEMGQAIVSYMQRNGVNDAPIIPPAPVADEAAQPKEENADVAGEAAQETSEEDQPAASEPDVSQPQEAEADEPAEPVEIQAAETESAQEENLDSQEEDFENLSFLDDVYAEETDFSEGEVTYDQVSEEVSEILEQADDLAAHTVPDPVVQPEPIDVPIPEPIVETDEASIEETKQISLPSEVPEATPEQTPDAEESEEPAPRKKSHWLRNSIIILVVLAVLAVAAFFFVRYYFLPIDAIRVEGSEDKLTVYVDSIIDDDLLIVECSDPDGTTVSAPVVDGKAVFEGLQDNTGYSVKVLVKGFHKLTGESSTAYSTPVQTSLLQFSAVTGSNAGSLVVGFSVDGPESDEWLLTYWADGEPETSVTFSSRLYTLEGLTVGKEYTLKLEPVDELYTDGEWTLKVTASDLIYAQDLVITGCVDGNLSLSWSAPADVTVDSWTIRCYSDNGYNETLVSKETSAVFANVDPAAAHTVEVIAAGMSVSQRAYMKENSINISDISAVSQKDGTLLLSWSADCEIPEGGWILTYSVDGYEVSNPIYFRTNSVTIPSYVPGAKYVFKLQSTSGDGIVGMPYIYQGADAAAYTCSYGGYNVSASNMTFSLCKYPGSSNWNRYWLSASDYTSTFSSGAKASFLVHLNKSYGTSSEIIHITYVIRDAQNTPVLISSASDSWSNLWYRNYCELDIPAIPTAAGKYTIEVYFNGMLASTNDLTIV